jgi:hypothetical protein
MARSSWMILVMVASWSGCGSATQSEPPTAPVVAEQTAPPPAEAAPSPANAQAFVEQWLRGDRAPEALRSASITVEPPCQKTGPKCAVQYIGMVWGLDAPFRFDVVPRSALDGNPMLAGLRELDDVVYVSVIDTELDGYTDAGLFFAVANAGSAPRVAGIAVWYLTD